MAQPKQQEPRYAPGCSEDNIYFGNNVFQKKRQKKSRITELLALLIVICIALLYWKTHSILPANDGAPDTEITSVDRGATNNIINVSITVTNNTGLPFYDVSATAKLYDENQTQIDQQTNLICAILTAGESKDYTFSFSNKDYTQVCHTNVETRYQNKP